MDFNELPKERQAFLFGVAEQLWRAAWNASQATGECPPLSSLSVRNIKRWIAAALVTERLMAQEKDDAVSQRAVINLCIATLQKLRDTPITIEGR